jgi:predicted Zn-dependent protease
MQRYIREQWAANISLADLDPISVNGLDAAIGEARVATNNGQRDVWLVAVRWNQNTIYRFVLLAQPGQLGTFRDGFSRTLESFRPLSAAEAAALKPQRLDVIAVGSGDTVESLAARMPYPDYRAERFRVLNGLPPNAALTPGQRVKIVVE